MLNDLFLDLQAEQHRHDEEYHRDIAALSIHPRLVHMALHFAKYTGRLAADPTAAVRTFTDALLIALATGNTLNVNLGEHLPVPRYATTTLFALGSAYLRDTVFRSAYREHRSLVPIMVEYAAIAAARIADGCEKIDHLEDISYRSYILTGTGSFTALALAFLASRDLDPTQAIRDRHAEIARRSLNITRYEAA